MLKDQASIKLRKTGLPTRDNFVEETKEDNTKDDTIEKEQSKKSENIFVKYSSLDINNINLKELRNINKDVFAWLSVDGTNINYPILHTTDNEHYLKYNINQERTTEGWPFMDYRNSKMMLDNNTTFYGHNLLNGTNFGSIVRIFKKDWFNNSNHLITLLTDTKKYTYEIFSCYETGDSVDYLENIFYSSEEYSEFLNRIKGRLNK